MAGDAFGRTRVSAPLTLFDSSHRYNDNGLWSTSTGTGGTYAFNANQGLVDLNVTTVSGAEVVRETNKVCSYQPGKSLQVMNTFVMASGKTNLRQRVGYYGASNGIYLEVSGTSAPSFVSVALSRAAVLCSSSTIRMRMAFTTSLRMTQHKHPALSGSSQESRKIHPMNIAARQTRPKMQWN
jgi:hypothetical protein